MDGHTQRIENALWEFIWLINKVTKEENGIGLVLKGKPVKINEIASDLKRDERAVRRHLKTLEEQGYINLKRCPYGLVVTINNSKKFASRPDNNILSSSDKNVLSERASSDKNVQEIGQKCPPSSDKNVRNKEDRKHIYKTDNNSSCQDSESPDVKPDKFSDDSLPFKLSKFLYSKILLNNPKQKLPNFQEWSKHIDYMIRIDKRIPQEVKEIIEWCQKDSFWYANILSTAKLREKYDQLFIKMKGQKNGGTFKKHFENERDYTSEEQRAINKKFYRED